MKNSASAFVVGFLFSIGLGLSGMTNPQKVVGFLDVFGAWDPSLAFVMIGSIATHFITFKLIRKRKSPLFSSHWHLPTKKEITKSLVFGSLIFGIGWGLAGFCPGPAVTNLASAEKAPWVFVLSMIAGMFLFKLANDKWNFNR